MLRLWRVSGGASAQGSDEDPVWRVTLESAQTRERLGFDSLDALCRYLREQIGGAAERSADDH
jgi:hypothetical protein